MTSFPLLERICPKCYALGVVAADAPSPRADDAGKEPSQPCRPCGGKGLLPTDEGRRLIEFVRRHL